MRIKGLLAALMLLHITVASALTVSVSGYGEVPAEGLVITLTEAEEDLLTGDMQMKLQGNLLATGPLTVVISRSREGLADEFCCAGQCTAGTGAKSDTLHFNPSGVASWYSHYVPEPQSRATVTYTFDDGQDTLSVKVKYLYGVDPVPASFPKKHLIEEFTGQDCGYCPYGMDCIHDFMGNDTNWVLILHHYGYQADHFSVAGSKSITSSLGVSGAPSATINRAKTKTSEGSSIVFHPGYLSSANKSQFATETYASVHIDNAYNPETRELTVTVSGAVAEGDHPALNLTVLVKESGMVDYQSDYYNTYEGWAEFRHANAVRVFLSAAKGDAVTVEDDHYTATYTTTLKDAWVPDNCMVVAFLAESFRPVVQAEQRPVVDGTEGGADILHGGITAVEVPDYYPEYNATDGPGDITGNKSEKMTSAAAYYESYSGGSYCTIQAYNTSATKRIHGINCVPFAIIYVFTPNNEKRLHTGVYEFNTSMQPGTAYAGFRDDENYVIDGSEFYFTNLSYLQQGYLVPEAEWLIADGTLTITTEGWQVDGHARNGAEIHFYGTGVITNGGYENEQGIDSVTADPSTVTRKEFRDGGLLIRRGDRTFTPTGMQIR